MRPGLLPGLRRGARRVPGALAALILAVGCSGDPEPRTGAGSDSTQGAGIAASVTPDPGEHSVTQEHGDGGHGDRAPNRLIHEKSPYLQQHAYNPVDWYPWGEEAFERARTEDKPIFLSIGYSTCHWCHVMEHESFENEEIAAFLNANFIPIKVDREERPDVDHVYMTAVQGMTGQGGWPLSVFLTPELKPFYGGTYFPPFPARGMPGFLDLLNQLGAAWTSKRADVVGQAGKVTDFLDGRFRTQPVAGADTLLVRELLATGVAQLGRSFDAQYGGFGSAPKFPTPQRITYLLRYVARTGDERALEMVRVTLDRMAAGGIHDHLGGGFHRYSTDATWLVPHFEKMLYDQAGLAMAYTTAWQVTGEARYRKVAEDLLDYVLRDLTHPEGGFYSAEDADSEGEEGTFYVWTPSEIDAILGADRGALFREAYRITERGNFEGKNIPHLREYSVDQVASLAADRRKLFEVREGRIRPHRDEKVISGWNGFMIEAFAMAGAAFNESRYIEGAERAMAFVDRHLWVEGRLLRHYKDGASTVAGFVDDYAYMARGALALHQATGESRHLARARTLATDMMTLFHREDGALAFSGNDGEELIAEVVESYDGAFPSGNSAGAMVLLRLGHLTADNAMEERGWRILRTFAGELAGNPPAFMELLSALDFALGPRTEIVIAAGSDGATAREMQRLLHDRYLPNTVVAYRPDSGGEAAVTLIPYLAQQVAIDSRTTAYLCRDYACRLPVHTVEALRKQLDDTLVPEELEN